MRTPTHVTRPIPPPFLLLHAQQDHDGCRTEGEEKNRCLTSSLAYKKKRGEVYKRHCAQLDYKYRRKTPNGQSSVQVDTVPIEKLDLECRFSLVDEEKPFTPLCQREYRNEEEKTYENMKRKT